MQGSSEQRKQRRWRVIQFIFVIIIVIMTSIWLHNTAKDTWADGAEISKLRRTLSTQTGVCTDLRHIGGYMLGPEEVGARDICFDPEIGITPGDCLVYSFGVGRDWSFDLHMAKLGCQIHAFDPLLIGKHRPHSYRNLIKLHNVVLGCEDRDGVAIPRNFNTTHSLGKQYWHKRTLGSIIKSLRHTGRRIDVLQLDMGHDIWTLLPTMLKDGSLTRHIKQIVYTVDLDPANQKQFKKYNEITEWLATQGFKLYHQKIHKYGTNLKDLSWMNEWLMT